MKYLVFLTPEARGCRAMFMRLPEPLEATVGIFSVASGLPGGTETITF